MSIKPPMRPFTRSTNEEPVADYVVLGGNHVGEAVASRLQASGHDVVVVTDAPTSTDVRTLEGDPAELSTLVDLGLAEKSTVLVATRSDAQNLLVAQLVRANFDVLRTFVLTNRPDRASSVDAAGHEPICATTAIADAVVEEL
jgi:Trk K+ transport system NAD-binding subunit